MPAEVFTYTKPVQFDESPAPLAEGLTWNIPQAPWFTSELVEIPQNPLARTPRQTNPEVPRILLLGAGPTYLLLSDGKAKPDTSIGIAADAPSPEPPEPRHGIIFDASENTTTPQPNLPHAAFTKRLETLRPRIERIIRKKWYDEYDTYELDNLVQAGIVHIWKAYQRNPEKLDTIGDPYWYGIAKKGATYEVVREYRRHVRQKGSGSQDNRSQVHVVLSAGDILAAKNKLGEDSDLDETSLSCETVFSSENDEIKAADLRMDIPSLERMIYKGTDPSDHPLIREILCYMREGLSQREMAALMGVKAATIRCAVRRMRQACGAVDEMKSNRVRPGDTLDAQIKSLRDEGLSAPAIGRRVRMHASFIYRRLEAMQSE